MHCRAEMAAESSRRYAHARRRLATRFAVEYAQFDRLTLSLRELTQHLVNVEQRPAFSVVVGRGRQDCRLQGQAPHLSPGRTVCRPDRHLENPGPPVLD